MLIRGCSVLVLGSGIWDLGIATFRCNGLSHLNKGLCVFSSKWFSLFSAAMLATTVSSPISAAQNVILIIGDGMDDQQITMARNYLHGAEGALTLDSMPARSAVQVITRASEPPFKPIYVADSANSATAIATGVTTSRGRISTSVVDADLRLISQDLKEAGYAVGIVSTASVTDATPAVFMANISRRFCENPGAMQGEQGRGLFTADCPEDLIANGGKGSISEQIARSPVDLVLGGGMKHFEPLSESGQQTVLDLARSQGFRIMETLDDIAAVQTELNNSATEAQVSEANRSSGEGALSSTSATGSAAADESRLQVSSSPRLLGLFTPSTMPVRWISSSGEAAQYPEPSMLNHVHEYLGEVELPEPVRCEPNAAYGATPPLAKMTELALAQLSQRSDKGFFLMVESASIDKQSHARRPCGQIGELAQLEESLQLALAFAEQSPGTIVLVTADHGQAAQIIPDGSMFAGYGIPVYTPGQLQRVITPEGSVMAMNYATNEFQAEEHTGVNVPLFGNEAAEPFMRPFLQQSDLHGLILNAFGLSE